MKNRPSGMDPELERKIEGLTPSQIKLMASIYAGIAEQLREKTVTQSLAKWKRRDDYSKN